MTLTAGMVGMTSTERVRFGEPAADALRAVAEMLGAERVVLIASKSLVENTDEITKIETALGARHAATFSGVEPHVPRDNVMDATEVARKANADLIGTIEESLQIADEGKRKRAEAEEKLDAMEVELRDTLASAKARKDGIGDNSGTSVPS